MISERLHDSLRCPMTGEPLEPAPGVLMEILKREQRDGRLFNRIGVGVEEEPVTGLVNSSRTFFIMVQSDIPNLIPDELIPLDHLEFPETTD